MEKRDAAFLLLLLGGGGYAVYANWDTIADRLGLHELNPRVMKAVDLAKESRDFEPGVANWQHLQARRERGEIEFAGDPWSAELIQGHQYRVVARWRRGEHVEMHGFTVNVATRTVSYDGALDAPAAPR